jgi:hypothetical protein
MAIQLLHAGSTANAKLWSFPRNVKHAPGNKVFSPHHANRQIFTGELESTLSDHHLMQCQP